MIVVEEEEDNLIVGENRLWRNRCEEFRGCRQHYPARDYQEEEEHYVIINGMRSNLRP